MYKSIDSRSALEGRVRFGTSPLLETCYALSLLLTPTPRIEMHRDWVRAERRRMGKSLRRRLADLGDWPMLWISLVDAMPAEAMQLPLKAGLVTVAEIPARDFATRLLSGLLHDAKQAAGVTAGESSLREATTRVPRSKREWLIFTGLYPYQEQAPAARVLERLIDDPAGVRSELLGALDAYWDQRFRHVWEALAEPLARSVADAAHRWETSTPREFADGLRLRIEIDEDRQRIGAIRGGYRLPISELTEAWFLPSMFNVHHFWHAMPAGDGTVGWFPYLDTRLHPGIAPVAEPGKATTAPVDPALVFKALGDATRYAILLLLARRPRTMTELAADLSLSKPTISHHTYLLREAGLLTETVAGKSVLLGVHAPTLAGLSTRMLAVLDEQAGAANTDRRRARPGRRR